MYDGSIIIGTEIDTKDFNAQIKKVESDLEKNVQELNALSKAKPYNNQIEDVREYSARIEKLNNRLVELKRKQSAVEKSNLDIVSKSMGKIGDSVGSVLKMMGKWALAIFAIESAYSFIRNAVSQVSQYNSQVANDIEYMRYSIATALEPLVVRIINLAKKLLALINALSIKIFGVDLFSRATAENFNQASKNANKLKKTLAGFDTANVLNDNGNNNGVSISQGEIIDWNEETAKMNSWLETSDNKIEKWSANLSSKWKNLGTDMKEALYNPDAFTQAYGYWDLFIYGIVNMFYGLYDTLNGFFQSCVGVFQLLVGAITGNTDMIKQGWENLVDGMITLIEGVLTVCIGIFQTISGVIRGIVGEVISGIKGMLNILIGAVNTVIKGINKIKIKNPFNGESWSPTIPTIPTFKMATGGIINAPNRGVPVASNVIGGEAGREGILPLTNAQAMEELGKEIGKHIAITIDLTNKLDGRVLSKTIEEVKTKNVFASNGG